VENERGRITRVEVGRGGESPPEFGGFFVVFPAEEVLDDPGGFAFGSFQVEGAIDINDGRDVTGDVGVSAGSFERFVIGGIADHHGEMSTRRASDGNDFFRIDIERIGVFPHPADGTFGIFDGGGEFGFLAESIADGGNDVSLLSEPGGVDAVVLALTCFPASAVNEDEAGDFSFEILGFIEVEFEGTIANLSIFDPFLKLDIGRERGILVDEFYGPSDESGHQEIAIGESPRWSFTIAGPAGEVEVACGSEEENREEEAGEDTKPTAGFPGSFFDGRD